MKITSWLREDWKTKILQWSVALCRATVHINTQYIVLIKLPGDGRSNLKMFGGGGEGDNHERIVEKLGTEGQTGKF